ncbi:hypothetical protein [Photobacterium kagoshimensis]|uniref:hypothetical protein n=1 Tax=Photobacterium kagoshimensis TaxID=2910242 RepID=UPI003D0B1F3F
MCECSLVTAPTSVFGFYHGSAVAVIIPRTHWFLNFSAIAAPVLRIAAFNIVVGALVGKWLHFGGCRSNQIAGDVRGLNLAAFLSVFVHVSGSSFLGKP